MNPAPVSASDLGAVRKVYLERLGAAMDRQRAIVASAAYQAGEPEAVAARYRIHFQPSLKRPEDYESMMARMKAGFISPGERRYRESTSSRRSPHARHLERPRLQPVAQAYWIGHPDLGHCGRSRFYGRGRSTDRARDSTCRVGHCQGLRAFCLSRMRG